MDEEVIPILRAANAAEAVTWYERLGFTKEWEHRFEPGMPAFVSIARGRGRPKDEPPYGCEIELRDPDGNRLRISTPAS